MYKMPRQFFVKLLSHTIVFVKTNMNHTVDFYALVFPFYPQRFLSFIFCRLNPIFFANKDWILCDSLQYSVGFNLNSLLHVQCFSF